ncbi:MAG: DUF2156 domain-containing protein [Peptococcaceae bacterium]|jgi:hypothetical protein|nr:DUF2156 domain-containing protein [Peptococcaceae bacterium]MBQ5707989.1 DUF2156 domain-containing protein [Peptococcaceae bacterium]
MIEFKNLTLEDKPTIDRYFREVQPRNSECTFTNMFIWRDCYEVQWAIVDGLLIVKPGQMDESWILQPYGDYTKCDLRSVFVQLDEYFSSQGMPFIMRAVTESFAQLLETEYPGLFYLEEERDLFDYTYLGEDLRELKGRKYHSKRNHLSNFRKNHPDYVYEPMTEDMVEEVWQYLESWCGQKACSGSLDSGLHCEQKAIREALDHFEVLDYKGAVIRLDGNIVAFTLGEMLNDNTVIIHVEKADGTITGLYGAINQEFLLHEWPTVQYVNREEDTGAEGLRKAKLSYHPVELIKKYKGVYRHGGK